MAGRRSRSDAWKTRVSILRRAADMASVEGLRSITIGRLAGDLGLSKAENVFYGTALIVAVSVATIVRRRTAAS